MKDLKTTKSLLPSKEKLKKVSLIALGLILVLLLVFPLILDIPYLRHPETTYLNRLNFYNGGSDYTQYYLQGFDITGKNRTFELSTKELEEGRRMQKENPYTLCAKVSYLPHTSFPMSIEFLPKPDSSIPDLYPPSPSLPKHWDSFSIQINDTVYSLPLPLTAFLNAGWNISAENEAMELSGTVGSHAQYEHEMISLINENNQTLQVTVYNTTEKTIPVTESTVGTIYISGGNYAFSGTQLRLPGGLMPGWSTLEDVLNLYGAPDKNFEMHRFTYQTDTPAITSFWDLYFDESGILENIMVHNQPYFQLDQ